jgi:phosphoribosyl 1,2-cyclic phosphate phosphodiesterase
MISWENYTYVVDCGPDFRQQMLASKCDKMDGIFLLTNIQIILLVLTTV